MGNIIISGQGLSLRRSGGVGRYGTQLCQRIKANIGNSLIKDSNLYFSGLDSIDVGPTDVGRNLRQSNLARLKHLFHRSLPPFFFDWSQKTYNHLLVNRVDSSERDNRICLPEWIKCKEKTLIHELTNYGVCEFAGRMVLNPNCLLVVTFLDIQDIFYPEYFTDRVLLKRRLAYSFYKDKAELILAISHFTKQTLVEYLGIPEEKIIVTHLAADDIKKQVPVENNKIGDAFAGRFWLYPAKFWKHKNHAMLLKALGKVQKIARKEEVRLVLTGGFSQKDLADLSSLIQENCVEDLVEVLGFVSDSQLESLFRQAEYMIFPSLFEGFGMPVLEAMTFGCPVLSSNAGSLPEIGGDAALYFDATNEEDFVSLIESILQGNGPDRNVLISNGFKNIQRFSWEETYKKTVDGYKSLLG